MATELSDLQINEVSVVDAPSNAEVVNGRKIPRATVALTKRDDSGNEVLSYKKLRKYLRERGFRDVEKVRRPKQKDDPGTQDVNEPEDEFVRTPPVQSKSKKGKKKMSKIKKILKSGTASRDEIARAINKRALKIAKKAGHAQVTSADYEQALLKDGAYQAYENAPKETQIAKAASPTIKITKSEARATDMALKLAKREGLSFAQALSKVFLAHPELYASYETEKAEGQMYEVPGLSASDLSDKFNGRGKAKSVADHSSLDDEDDEDEDDDKRN